MMASASFGSRSPLTLLACAQAFLITPSARTMATGCFSHPMGKFMIERCVCAPQYLSAGTSSGPKLSVSVRVAVMIGYSYAKGCPVLAAGAKRSMLYAMEYNCRASELAHALARSDRIGFTCGNCRG